MTAKQGEFQFLSDFSHQLPTHVQKTLVAHRGFHSPIDSLSRPIENTKEAFEAAWKGGLSMCECDVTVSSDGKIIFGHDETFERLAMIKNELHKANLGDLTSTELKSLCLVDNSSALFLDEMIETLQALKVPKLVVEIKPSAPSKIIAEKLLENIKYLENPISNIPIIMSFRRETTFEVQKLLTQHLSPDEKPQVLLLLKGSEGKENVQKLKPLNTNFEGPSTEVDLSDSSAIDYIMNYFLYKNGITLDGVYMQFDKSMLEKSKTRENIKKMSNKFAVGVWLGQGDRPYDRLSTVQSLREAGVSFVNTDVPRDGFF